jgi:hypothetical protein
MSDRTAGETMIVSVREVAVLARQTMLALELPHHVVTDAARILAELEIQDRLGIRYLDDLRHSPQLLATAPLKLLDANTSRTVLDAQGASALVVGPSLLDLPSALGRLNGGGLLLCRNVSGLPALPCLVEQGRRRGVSTLVVVAPIGGFEQPMPSPILTRFASVDGIARSLLQSASVDLQRLAGSAIDACVKGEDSTAWLPALATASGVESAMVRWPDLSERGDAIIACAKPAKAGAQPKRSAHRWPRDGGYDWIEMGETSVPPDAAEMQAMTEGIPVDKAFWRELMAFANTALVASSECSRRDAGPYSGAGTWRSESLE